MWSLENPAVKNGIIAGILSVVLILLVYLVKSSLLASGGFAISTLTTALFVYLMYLSTKAEKDATSEHFSFNDAVKPAFVCYVVGNVIYYAFYFVFLNYIAPEVLQMQQEMAIEMVDKLSGITGEEAAEQAVRDLEAKGVGFGLGQAAIGFLFSLIFPGFVVAAIIAATLRDPRPQQQM